MKLSIQGTIIDVAKEKKTTSASFKEFLVQTKEQYPQKLKFTMKFNKFTEEIFDILENYVGADAEIFFNISGNEWQGKHYVQLNAWKIDTRSKPEQISKFNDTIANEDLPF